MSKQIKILDTIIEPGKSYQLSLDIARLHTRTKLDIPVIIERAKKDGPCILITAGIHGNEVNGIEIVRQLVAKKYNKPEYGTIICVPVVNVFGFIIQKREFPDGRDLNRTFPGSAKGSLASRFSYFFMKEIVRHADYCIDLHTGGANRFNYSQIRVNENDEEALKLAHVFGSKFIKISSVRDNSYRDSATKLGKKVLLFEGGKSLHLDRKVTNYGLHGVLNVLNYLKINKFPAVLVGEIEPEKNQISFSNSKWVRAKHSGMFRTIIANGKHVNKSEIIGSITDPYGFFERKVKAPVNGHIICLNHSPIVNQGDALVHIAID